MAIFYVVLFFVFSFVGWTLDSAYRSLLRRRFISSGYFFPIPLCPVYGLGSFALLFTFKFLSGYSLIIQIFIGGSAAILTELFSGLFCVRFLKARIWDYSQIPFNFLGLINLFHSVGWFLVTIIFYIVVFPQVILAEKFFGISNTLTVNDVIVLVFSIVIAALVTWVKYQTGPKNYCVLPGYSKKTSK